MVSNGIFCLELSKAKNVSTIDKEEAE